MPRKAQAQIGILGHVMRVPAAQLLDDRAAEKQRRPPQRHHKAQPRKARQDDTEPGGIVDGEAARQPVVPGVVEIELPLQAGDILGRGGKAAHDLDDLAGIGFILGIPDPDDRAAAEIEREVQCARLGPDRPVRHPDHPHPARQPVPGKGRMGGAIVVLDHQEDVEQFLGIVDPAQPFDQTRDDVALAKERHHDRNHRQLARQRRWRRGGAGRAHRGQTGGRLDRHARDHRQDRPERQQGDGRAGQDSEAHQQPAQHRRADDPRAGVILTATAFLGRDTGFRAPGKGGGILRDQHPFDVAWRRQRHHHRADALGQLAAQAVEFVGARGQDHRRPAAAAPGDHAMAQAEGGAKPAGQARVGRHGDRIDRLHLPLQAQCRRQVGLAHPAARQKDIAQPDILPVAQRQRAQQVFRRDRPHVEKDLPQRAAARGRAERGGAIGRHLAPGRPKGPHGGGGGILDQAQMGRRHFRGSGSGPPSLGNLG